MLELLNDPQVRLALTQSARVAFSVLVVVAVLVMVADGVQTVSRRGDQ